MVAGLLVQMPQASQPGQTEPISAQGAWAMPMGSPGQVSSLRGEGCSAHNPELF